MCRLCSPKVLYRIGIKLHAVKARYLHIVANKIVKLRLGAEKRIHFIQQQISDIERQIINAQPCFDPHFDNPEFRKAISLSIDNKEIVNRVFLDKADVGTAGFYSINSPFAKKGLDYKYDVKEAEKILDSLGYDKKNESGIRLTKEGKELSFEILSSNNAMRQSAATIISEQLKKVGIK